MRGHVRLRAPRPALLLCLLTVGALAAFACAHGPRLSPDEHLRRGHFFEQGGRSWEAMVEYRKALAKEPGDVETRLRLADLQAETGDDRSAERNYRQILRDDPGNTQATNNLCWLYTRTGWHLDWALEAMKPLLEEPSPYRHAYLDTLGMLHFKRREYTLARDAFQEAAELCDSGTVMSSRAECRRIEEHLAAARARVR